MTKLETGISPNYVKGWTIAKALRELVQNHLDSKQEFACGGWIRWKDGRATLKDNGPGIEPRHLALGVSEKSIDAKGKYGEGLKLALLVLARERRFVEVQANGRVIRPVMVESKEYGTTVLRLEIDQMTPRLTARHKGTTIRVECTEEELETAKQYFIEYAGRTDQIDWLEQGKLSLPGGEVYVNGTKIGRIQDAMFSYHLNERTVGNIGNRDREVVNMAAVTKAAQVLLGNTRSTVAIRALLGAAQDAAAGETPTWETKIGLDGYQIPRTKRRVWLRVARQLFGRTAVVNCRGREAANQAAYRGYTVLPDMPWTWNGLLVAIGMPTAEEVLDKRRKAAKVVKLKELLPNERDNLRTAKRLVGKHTPLGKLRIVDEIATETDARTLGTYDRATDVITLALQTLRELDVLVATLIHEAVHRNTNKADITAAFEAELGAIAARILLAGRRKGGA